MLPFLVAMMLLTGVANTILTKKQDMVCVRNCDAQDPKKRAYFNQPVLQTLQMFIGEMGCWLVVGGMNLYKRYVVSSPSADGYEAVDTNEPETADPIEDETASTAENGNKPDNPHPLGKLAGRRVLLLAIPAICDICGTTLMNIGLLLVAASIYQMTRGALVLFVGLFSVVFLKRHLHPFQWISLVGVVLGVAVVGLAGVIYPDHPVAKGSISAHAGEGHDGASTAVLALVGVVLIAFAQIFTATQFVAEESIMEKSTIDPIKVVGWEGLFGFLVTILGMVVLHFAVGRTKAGKYGYFDMVEGWRQVSTYPELLSTSILIMISIG
jgi:drug/metabolite transporter (DMT)-like permease